MFFSCCHEQTKDLGSSLYHTDWYGAIYGMILDNTPCHVILYSCATRKGTEPNPERPHCRRFGLSVAYNPTYWHYSVEALV